MRLVYLVGTLIVSGVTFAQPQLLKDIHKESPVFNGPSITDGRSVKFKNHLYFPALSSEYGREIFSTDGTSSGTQILKNIYPGQKGIGSVVSLGATDNLLFFGFQGEDGHFLWKSDGTEVGTEKIIELETYASEGYVAWDNVIFFSARNEQHGSELWRSDGTTGGTFMVKDINPGVGDSRIDVIEAADDQIFFFADDGINGRELWRSDGTEQGTMLVKNISPGGGGLSSYLTVVGNSVYFNANDGSSGAEVWKSDGTEEGTAMATNFTDDELLFREKMLLFGNKLMFLHYKFEEGKEWYTLNINTGEYEALSNMSRDNAGYTNAISPQPVIMNGYAWFFAKVGPTITGKEGIWKTDGTPEHTDLAVGSDNFDFFFDNELIAFNGKLYITTNYNLRATDGVNPLTDVWISGGVRGLKEINGKLFFATNGEPWISDGTASGTNRLKDINTNESYGILKIIPVGDRFIIFNVNAREIMVYDLWISDGTTSGTEFVQSFVNLPPAIAVSQGQALFRAQQHPTPQGSLAIKTWMSDGTKSGTKPLDDGAWITTGEGAGHIQWVGNTAFMFSGGRSLWKTDGTFAGVTYLKTLPMDPYGQTAAFKNALYFFVGGELWKSDGSEAGTVKVAEVAPPGSQQIVHGFMAGANKMYFVALTTGEGVEVWTSDGTEAGTHIVKDIHVNDSYIHDYNRYHPALLAVINDVAYFSASESYERELWRTDGTMGGTFVVKDIFPGARGSSPAKVALSESMLYFTANDGDHGFELWKTDGTSEGTVLIRDIYPGKLSPFTSVPPPAAFINEELYFAADDGLHGTELWKTDGTSAGTSFVFEVNPGILNGLKHFGESMVSSGSKMLFVGIDQQHGPDLWVYDNAPPVTAITDERETLSPIWPNPATSTLSVDGEFSSICLYDMLGRSVLSTHNEPTFDVSYLPRGIYFVRLKKDNFIVSHKVVLK